MTKSARLQIRINPETKRRSEELFASKGLSMATAVNLFIAESLRVGSLPFEYTAEALIEAQKRTPSTKNKSQKK